MTVRKARAGGPWPGQVIEEVREGWEKERERGSSPHLLPKHCKVQDFSSPDQKGLQGKCVLTAQWK